MTNDDGSATTIDSTLSLLSILLCNCAHLRVMPHRGYGAVVSCCGYRSVHLTQSLTQCSYRPHCLSIFCLHTFQPLFQPTHGPNKTSRPTRTPRHRLNIRVNDNIKRHTYFCAMNMRRDRSMPMRHATAKNTTTTTSSSSTTTTSSSSSTTTTTTATTTKCSGF